MTATPSQEWTATTGESAAFRDLILKACFDLGFHGLRVDNPDAVASLASLVANASRLGSVVDNAELSAEVARLRAENERLNSRIMDLESDTVDAQVFRERQVSAALRSQLAATREGETPDTKDAERWRAVEAVASICSVGPRSGYYLTTSELLDGVTVLPTPSEYADALVRSAHE